MKKKFYTNIFLFPLLLSFLRPAFNQKRVSFLQKGTKLSDNAFYGGLYALEIQSCYFSIYSGLLNSLRAFCLAPN
jgi:hypothetical protein